MTIQLLRKKFTVSQYHQMMDSGILTEGDRLPTVINLHGYLDNAPCHTV
jgi:hypothetical protein